MIHAVPSACKDVTHLISFRFGFLAILVGNMYIIYRELGLNRVFARLQVEEIWNCCRIRPPDRSHGLMVIVVSSEGRHHLTTNKYKVKILSFFKIKPTCTGGVIVPDLTGPVSWFSNNYYPIRFHICCHTSTHWTIPRQFDRAGVSVLCLLRLLTYHTGWNVGRWNCLVLSLVHSW